MKYYTGNEYLSLLKIKEDMSINGLSAMSMDLKGNLFIDCNMKLRIFIDEEEVDLSKAVFELIDYWIPFAKITHKDIELSLTIIAPKETRGFIYNLQINNKSTKNVTVRLENEYLINDMSIDINASYKLNAERIIYYHDWFNGVIFSIRSYKNIFALAFLADEKYNYAIKEDKTKINFVNNLSVGENENRSFNYYIGAGLEDVSALYSSIYLKRLGFTSMFESLKKWLENKICKLKDKYMEKICNINSFFNYFYAFGRAIDTEMLIALTSRSPEYYVSGAYWDRDSLLWSFPNVLAMGEMQRAREILEYVFKIQSKNSGIHSRFINGTVLEPGFELDELCAPFIALENYVKASGDRKFLREEYVHNKLLSTEEVFEKWKHENSYLYKTELRPSDDPADYEYNTYDNVLVWKAFDSLHFLLSAIGKKGIARHYLNMSRKVKTAIKRHAFIKKEKLIAYEFDMKGNYRFYEEPAGSLRLLAFYGFIDDDIKEYYENTLKWSYSGKNENFFEKTFIKESGSFHAKHPWTLAAANSMLTPGFEKFGEEFFKNSIMDDYIASESVDENTGMAATGAAFATCAGFVAFAISNYYRKNSS